jgi:hypothetical protein
LNNPTTITLGPERRKEVANIIRHTGTMCDTRIEELWKCTSSKRPKNPVSISASKLNRFGGRESLSTISLQTTLLPEVELIAWVH